MTLPPGFGSAFKIAAHSTLAAVFLSHLPPGSDRGQWPEGNTDMKQRQTFKKGLSPLIVVDAP